jgi:hypothetical protein
MKNWLIAAVAVAGLGVAGMTDAVAKERTTGRGTGPVVYVESQGLYYDSIVVADLPPKGPFQQLFMDGMDISTEFGPGDVGYYGGRWWVDVNGDGEMDAGDMYFLCPLLGPGRSLD